MGQEIRSSFREGVSQKNILEAAYPMLKKRE